MLESHVASAARAFLEVLDRPELDQERKDRLSKLCSALAQLLGHALSRERTWTRYRCIESIWSWSEIAPSPTALEITGRAIWMPREANAFWVEPFFARLIIDEKKDELIDYIVQFADASTGLGETPYHAKSWGREVALPEVWMYIFSKQADDRTL